MSLDMNCLVAITLHRPSMGQQAQLAGIHWEHDPWGGGTRMDEASQLQLETEVGGWGAGRAPTPRTIDGPVH